MRRLRIGILFGGKSKEREVSFAGGRTVFDVMDRRWFDPVPLFLDGRNHLYRLDWPHLYSGSIRDFYPPPKRQPHRFPLYDDFLPPDETFPEVGDLVRWEDLPTLVDGVFLVLHGLYGEDGTVQGWLDFLEVPYTGSGVFPSALGVHKGLQKEWLAPRGFYFNPYVRIPRHRWDADADAVIAHLRKKLQFPVVVKPATQGSSVGVRWVEGADELPSAIDRAFFRERITGAQWHQWDENRRSEWLQRLADIQAGLGFPVFVGEHRLSTPSELHHFLEGLAPDDEAVLEGRHTETEVIVEEAVDGREFTCIVVEDESGEPVPLPPSEIVKSFAVFDYRAKYLAGVVRKRTPMDLPVEALRRIMNESRRLYETAGFEAYARIDGFYLADGTVYLNDPNTTSGMLPSSFLFHQAAEVGLTPTDMITWLIFNSLRVQRDRRAHGRRAGQLFKRLREALSNPRPHEHSRPLRVAVVFGGCSTERHISVESGRNVVEKLAAHPRFDPVPVFLHCGPEGEMIFHQVPLKLLMKDNADDIREAVKHFSVSEVSKETFDRLGAVRRMLGKGDYAFEPERIELADFPRRFDFVFIAVHGHPGEDGTLQAELERLGMPFNGSNAEVSRRTMNKYETNRLLRRRGFEVPRHYLVTQSEWESDAEGTLQRLENALGPYPYIAKPVDEGCSSAVLPIADREDLRRYAAAAFRTEPEVPSEIRRRFRLQPNAPFPAKPAFLVEEKIRPHPGEKLIEITGGVLAGPDEHGRIRYRALPPSEAIAAGGVLSLEEKFLAGEGVNITPARFDSDPERNAQITRTVQRTLEAVAQAAGIEGYCRIDAFVRIAPDRPPQVIVIEINSLPGLTPATVLFQQGALVGLRPVELLETIIQNGLRIHARR